MSLVDEIYYLATCGRYDAQVSDMFLRRAVLDSLTREENERSHFTVHFLPFNRTANQVFLVHHKKANLWIAPGGHIEQQETLLQTVNRELREELGLVDYFSSLPVPILLTHLAIDNERQPCKEHFDIWFELETDGRDFNVDTTEFYDTQWVSRARVPQFVSAPTNLKAIQSLSW